jgi:acyl carrier protein
MTTTEIQLRDLLARLLEVDAASISTRLPMTEQGIDSLLGLRFARLVQDQTGREIDIEWLFDYPTIEAFARCLDERCGAVTAAA